MKALYAVVLTGLAVGGVAPAMAATDGAALFAERCGVCHRTNGMGVGILARRPGDASKGLLENRSDLTVALITTVTRVGIGNMPRISRGEISDAEMIAIAEYLAKGNKP